MKNKIASLICGTDIDKIQNERIRINQENTRLKMEFNELSNTVRSLKQQIEQVNTDKEVLANDYENKLKEKAEAILELSRTIEKQQEEYNALQKEFGTVKHRLNDNLSNIISVVKCCDYAYVANELDKLESLQELLNQLERLLNQNDIYSITDVGTIFDENFHLAKAIIDTEDETEDMIISESLKRGFRKGHQCIEPQEVKITKKKQL